MGRKSRQSDFYVVFASDTPGVFVEGPFSKKTGGKVNKPSTQVRDGGSFLADRVDGFPEIEDIELSRPYDADRDASLSRIIIAELTRGAGRISGTLSIMPTDAELVPLNGSAESYQVFMTAIMQPEYDADSADVARISYTFAVRKPV